jgi:hypothetical protein
MNETFRQHVEQLHPKFEALLRKPAVRLASLPKEAATPGIYLFSEGPLHLYVGRSKNVRNRLKMHVGDPSGASFAFKLAREASGRQKATYAPEGSRTHLMTIPDFVQAFHAAKERIRAMDIRFVAEPDCNRQALLEIFATLALGTPYNDFETH